MLAINMNDSQSERFGDTIRKLQLYNDEGIAELSALFEQTGDEELLILAIEWLCAWDRQPKHQNF